MKIIKRSGAEVVFDPQKIIIAVSKANESVVPSARMSAVQIKRIAEDVESAALNISDEARVSHPMRKVGACLHPSERIVAAARPISIALSHDSSEFAIPLTPSVPNNLPIILSFLSYFLKQYRLLICKCCLVGRIHEPRRVDKRLNFVLLLSLDLKPSCNRFRHSLQSLLQIF